MLPFLDKSDGCCILFDTREGLFADEMLEAGISRLWELDGAFLSLGHCRSCLLDWPDKPSKETIHLAGVLDDTVSPPVVFLRLSCVSYCHSCGEKAAARRLALVDCCEARIDGVGRSCPRACVSYTRSYEAACRAGPPSAKASSAASTRAVARASRRGTERDGSVLLSSPVAAMDWASKHRGQLSDAEMDQLRHLDFSLPPAALRLLALTLMAVSEWALSAPQAMAGSGPAQRASAHTAVASAHRGGSPRARLRDWAVAVREDGNVLLRGGVARPSLRSCSLRGVTLQEALSAPPHRPSLASADQQALRLQRLSALLKQRSGRDVTQPWKVPTRELPARLVGLVAAFQQSGSCSGSGSARHGAAGGGPTPGSSAEQGSPGGRGPAKGTLSAEETLAGIGASLTQVQQALAKPHAGAVCAQCGRTGAVRMCKTCVDAFCTGCMPCNPAVLPDNLPELWCCGYCLASLPLIGRGDETLLPALLVSDLDSTMSRTLDHCRHADGTLGAAADLPIRPSSLLNAFPDSCRDSPALPGLVRSQPPQFWLKVVAVHALCLRSLEDMCRGWGGPEPTAAPAVIGRQGEVPERLMQLLRLLGMLLRHLAESDRPDALRREVFLALLRSDALQRGARLLASWHGLSTPSWLGAAAAVLREVLAVCHACAESIRERPPASRPAAGRGRSRATVGAASAAAGEGEEEVVREWRDALLGSQLLEHAARALLRLQQAGSAAAAAAAAGEVPGEKVEALAVDLSVSGTHIAFMIKKVQGSIGGPPEWELLHPRPLRAPRDGREERLLARLQQLRPLVSGPCLQYLLARDLVATARRLARSRGAQATGHSYGLTEEQLQAGAWRDAQHAEAVLLAIESAVPFWQVTVSGPRAPRVAQPPTGWLPGGPDAPAGVPPGLPFRAVNVYDMLADAMEVLLSSLTAEAATEVRVLPGLCDASELLARLLMELPASQAARRLPGLWRMWISMVSVVSLVGKMPSVGSLCRFGLLLRLEPQTAAGVQLLLQPPQQPEGEAPAPPPAEDQAQQAAGAMLQQAGAAGSAAAAAAAAGAVAEAPAAGCFPSIRVALDAGFLPAVELLLRRQMSGAEDIAGLVEAAHQLLRFSGVWAPALAHGPLAEVASLVVTLRKMSKGLVVKGNDALRVTSARTGLPFYLSKADVRLLQCSLLEQVAALMLPPLPPPQTEGSQAAVQRGGGAFDIAAAAGAGGGSGLEPGPRPVSATAAAAAGAAAARSSCQRVLLALNDAMDILGSEPRGERQGNGAALVQLEWLVRAGGRPAADSPAGQQQRLLTVFALTQWLPPMLADLSPSEAAIGSCVLPEEPLVVLRWLLSVGLQCLAARRKAGLLPEGGTALGAGRKGQAVSASGGGVGADAAACGAGADGTGGAVMAAAAAAYDSWSSFLDKRLKVWSGLVKWLMRQDPSPKGASERLRLSLAFDLLEVLAVALPGGLGQHIPHAGAGGSSTAPAAACSSAAGLAASTLITGPHVRTLQKHGRSALFAELYRVALASVEGTHITADGVNVNLRVSYSHSPDAPSPGDAAARPGGGGAAAAASSSAGAPAGCWPPPLCALLSEVLAKHDLSNLPPLPSPAEALKAVAAAGVRLCGNPACKNMEGPSEAALAANGGGKTCARCKAVWYCCGACQLAHWQMAHQKVCRGNGAQGAGGGGGGGGSDAEVRVTQRQVGGGGSRARSATSAAANVRSTEIECRMS